MSTARSFVVLLACARLCAGCGDDGDVDSDGSGKGGGDTDTDTDSDSDTDTDSDSDTDADTDCPAGYEVMSDGSFELGTPNSEWTEASTNFGTPICEKAVCAPDNDEFHARTGDFWAWFGGYEAGYEEGSLSQTVSFSDPPSLLVFYLWMPNADGPSSDELEVSIDETILVVANPAGAGYYPQYTKMIVDVSEWADGEPHDLLFRSATGGGGVTNFFVDDVSLKTGCGDADTDTDTDTDIDTDTDTDTDTDACGPEDLCERTVYDCGAEMTMDDCLSWYDDPFNCSMMEGYVECNCACLSITDCEEFLSCGQYCFDELC